MPVLVPIVEGDGDVKAVPVLLRNILNERQVWDWRIATPKKAGGLPSLHRRLPQFLQYAVSEPDCGAILILLDLDDGCPRAAARDLATAVRREAIAVPVAIVYACREYEAWFLASLPTLGGTNDLPADLRYDQPVEVRRGVKEWLSDQMPAGRVYKETIDQARMTAQINLALAAQHARSFRRLLHAIEELLAAAPTAAQGVVTPIITE